jgi:hypothetical protein
MMKRACLGVLWFATLCGAGELDGLDLSAKVAPLDLDADHGEFDHIELPKSAPGLKVRILVSACMHVNGVSRRQSRRLSAWVQGWDDGQQFPYILPTRSAVCACVVYWRLDDICCGALGEARSSNKIVLRYRAHSINMARRTAASPPDQLRDCHTPEHPLSMWYFFCFHAFDAVARGSCGSLCVAIARVPQIVMFDAWSRAFAFSVATQL